jgi:hypothetical protein
MMRAVAILGAAAIIFIATNVCAAGNSADLFIEQAYAPWINPALKRISDTELMSPEFMKLWQADDAAAEKRGEVGYVDGNLICACQDGQMAELNINVRNINATRATAHVMFTIDTNQREQVMVLKNEHGRWYVDDIITKGRSLAGHLREDARMRQRQPMKPATKRL